MKFVYRNLVELSKIVVGDNSQGFPYRSGPSITLFFEECGLPFVHDGSTRWRWTMERLEELLQEPVEVPHTLPPRFVHMLRVLMYKADALEDDPGRLKALEELNKPLSREGFRAFYDGKDQLAVEHIGTRAVSESVQPHRAFTQAELELREQIATFLSHCSEDELIEHVLVPLFRQLGFHRISVAGHKDKALEYGTDIWMRYRLPTQHPLYFGLQVKKGKLDSAGKSRGSNTNIAEIHAQLLMMLGHEIFDPETNKKALVDHAFIVAGGEITKAAKNWLGEKLDATKRSQILFMDRDDILDLYIDRRLPMPQPGGHSSTDDF